MYLNTFIFLIVYFFPDNLIKCRILCIEDLRYLHKWKYIHSLSWYALYAKIDGVNQEGFLTSDQLPKKNYDIFLKPKLIPIAWSVPKEYLSLRNVLALEYVWKLYIDSDFFLFNYLIVEKILDVNIFTRNKFKKLSTRYRVCCRITSEVEKCCFK